MVSKKPKILCVPHERLDEFPAPMQPEISMLLGKGRVARREAAVEVVTEVLKAIDKIPGKLYRSPNAKPDINWQIFREYYGLGTERLEEQDISKKHGLKSSRVKDIVDACTVKFTKAITFSPKANEYLDIYYSREDD